MAATRTTRAKMAGDHVHAIRALGWMGNPGCCPILTHNETSGEACHYLINSKKFKLSWQIL